MGVAVVADELDGGREAAGGAAAGARTPRRPAEVAGERSGGAVPDRLRVAVGGDEVEGGPIAVGVVARFAGGAHPQGGAPQDPERAVVEGGGPGPALPRGGPAPPPPGPRARRG